MKSEKSTLPHRLTPSFKTHWEVKLKNKSNLKLEESWNQMFNVFDNCIELNKKHKSEKHILPLITGTGKTQGAVHYCKNLDPTLTALIVTYRTEDADIISSEIGSTACSYHSNKVLSGIKVNHVTNIRETYKYQTLVITHEQFKLISKDPLGNKQMLLHKDGEIRDLVIIDEFIDLKQDYTINLEKLESIKFFFTKVLKDSRYKHNIQLKLEYEKVSDKIKELYNFKDNKKKQVIYLKKTKMTVKEQLNKKNIYFDEMINILNNGKNSLSNTLTGCENFGLNRELRDTYISTLESLSKLIQIPSYYYKKGTIVFLCGTEELYFYKSMVILDATSSINKFYELNKTYKENYIIYPQIQSRDFKNLEINIIPRNTGKNAFKHNAEEYAREFALEVSSLITLKDNVLIISFEAFIPCLSSYLKDPTIETAHWGNITGTNKYKDCNTLFIFGLNHKPKSAFINKRSVSRIDLDRAYRGIDRFGTDDSITNNELDLLIKSDLAHEIVQAIMRTQARKVIDFYGNCEITKIYITLNPKTERFLIDEMKSYFPNVTIKEYTPKTKSLLSKFIEPTISTLVIKTLDLKIVNAGDHLSKEELCKLTKLTKKQITDIIKTKEFKDSDYETYIPLGQKDSLNRIVKKQFFRKKQ